MILENNESHDFAGFCCVINVVVALFSSRLFLLLHVLLSKCFFAVYVAENTWKFVSRKH